MSNVDILRLALVLGGNTAQNFSTNLRKIVKLVLFDKHPKSIKISEIRSIISKQFMLEFDDNEILSSIKGDRGIIDIKDENTNTFTYSVTPNEFQKINDNQTLNIDDFIKHFLEENNSVELDFDSVKELIYHFLYFTFNSDAKTVLELLNKKTKIEEEVSISDEFSPEEATIINKFLNWDNRNKNEYILNMISACFDYCMLTIKKDCNSFSHVFNGKLFFLDTNIIFKLAGFDNADQKDVLDAFIKKCKDAGIVICYTNQTASEIESTINSHVDSLEKLLGTSPPISAKSMAKLDSQFDKRDFYEMYVHWCKNPRNKSGDFSSFKYHILREINKIIQDFKLVTFKPYNTKNKNFKELSEEFTTYKEEHYRHTNESAINVDINNYLYMVEKNDNDQAANFLEIKNYFISADHCLTEWAKTQRPGTIPIFVLPSVWYSILLKYKGRTEADYQSFCQFLNIRITPEKDPLINQKRAMLAYVLELNETTEIKEEILFDIETRLKTDKTFIENPLEFAEESHKTILDSKVSEVSLTLENAHTEKLKQIQEQSDEKIKREKDISKKEIKKAKSDGYSDGQKDILLNIARRKAFRNKIFVTIFKFIRFAVLIYLLFVLGAYLLSKFNIVSKMPKLLQGWLDNNIIKCYQDNDAIVTLFGVIITALSGYLKKFFQRFGLFLTDENKIYEILKKKHNIK